MTVLFTGFWFSRTTSLFPESARQIWCDFSDCCILLSQQHSCLSFSPLTPVSPDHCSYRVVIKWAVHGSYWKPSLFQNLPFRPRLPVAHSPLPTGWKWKTPWFSETVRDCKCYSNRSKLYLSPPPETEGGCNCRQIALTMWAGVRWHKTNPGQPLTWLYAGFCIELIVDRSF